VRFVKTQMKSFIGVDIKTRIIGYFSVESASKRLRQVLWILTSTVALGKVRKNKAPLISLHKYTAIGMSSFES
jgi:hypothetical protein